MAGEISPDCLGILRALLALSSRREVGGVATVVDELAATVEFDHAGGDAIEQVPIVADNYEATAKARQMPFQPSDTPAPAIVLFVVVKLTTRSNAEKSKLESELTVTMSEMGPEEVYVV